MALHSVVCFNHSKFKQQFLRSYMIAYYQGARIPSKLIILEKKVRNPTKKKKKSKVEGIKMGADDSFPTKSMIKRMYRHIYVNLFIVLNFSYSFLPSFFPPQKKKKILDFNLLWIIFLPPKQLDSQSSSLLVFPSCQTHPTNLTQTFIQKNSK